MNLIQATTAQYSKMPAILDASELSSGEYLFKNNDCQILTQSSSKFEFLLSEEYGQKDVYITIGENDDEQIILTPSTGEWNRFSYACLMQMKHELHLLDPKDKIEHKKYTRSGMIKRVLDERRNKALTAQYRIQWADNIYGDHILTNENGVKYKIFLRDFKKETGYSDSMDSAVNKLGTTKHIMFTYKKIKEDQFLFSKLHKNCPFIEIYCDPLNNYRISYFYPHELIGETKLFLSKYFNNSSYIEDDEVLHFADFLTEAQFFNKILIRPEVRQKVEAAWEQKTIESIRKNYRPDFSLLKARLYNYQEEGIQYAVTRKHAIIADEMGLGKTLQAIGAAVLKKKIFGFKRTLIVCPASLKAQWKKEIERFTDETALIIDGTQEERQEKYKMAREFFLIVNYETVLRDQVTINKAQIDFLILDEAQKVKNYATKTASAIKNINNKHVLIITGTPIENKLIDLFSIMTILDPHFLGPLWEFSYQYCLFDNEKHNKINGYYNLSNLKEKLKPILLRREKRNVIKELPHVQEYDIPVGMTPLQADYHASYAQGIGQITSKKFLTAFDMQRIQQLLTAMRMTCNSTYLIDEQTNDSPKLDELKYILLEKLDLRNQNRKVIIFSEWVKMHKLIGQVLRENNIGFAELNGKVPVTKRGELINRFETNESCKVFLSTEAGGAGLNLQIADILINFELPWNPSKKNQRIGRIDRLGQKSSNLTIFNLITENSIERRIALGLLVKQNLFDSVLNESATTDFVDFSEKGRSQFLQQMQEMADEFTKEVVADEDPQQDSYEDFISEELIQENVGQAGNNITPAKNNVKPEPTEQEPDEEKIIPAGEKHPEPQHEVKAEQMEQVLNNGMQFLSGLFQMATGKNVGIENQKIEINKETGEVTMKFKLPVN
jgi:SNF2 family DNA or RNA helicase